MTNQATTTTRPIEVCVDRFPNVPKALAHCAALVEEHDRIVDLVTFEGEFIRRLQPRRLN